LNSGKLKFQLIRHFVPPCLPISRQRIFSSQPGIHAVLETQHLAFASGACVYPAVAAAPLVYKLSERDTGLVPEPREYVVYAYAVHMEIRSLTQHVMAVRAAADCRVKLEAPETGMHYDRVAVMRPNRLKDYPAQAGKLGGIAQSLPAVQFLKFRAVGARQLEECEMLA